MEFPRGKYNIFKKFFHTNTHGSVYHGRKQKDMWELDITPEVVALGQWDVYGCSQHSLLIQTARKGFEM